MEVTVESTRIVKPFHDGSHPPPPSPPHATPLTVFDTVTFDYYFPVVYLFRSPTPSNSYLIQGLAEVLSVYREWAGRFGEGTDGRPAILLTDAGVQVVEASTDSTLDAILPLRPSPELRSLQPSTDGVEELLLVQLTRFACGSLAMGFVTHHRVADGRAVGHFLIAWGRACQGLPISLPAVDRSAFFAPREPSRVKFEHRDLEFKAKNRACALVANDDFALRKFHFTVEFLTKLKAEASRGVSRPYTTFESVVAHVWRAMTKARGLDGEDTTRVKISVDGRGRLSPLVPVEYFGNLVLWARPRAKAGELVRRPLQYAAGLIHDAIARVNDDYFRSFIDFASSGAVEEEGLVPTSDAEEHVLSPNMDVDSWMGIPFYNLDFGGGTTPFLFMPSYMEVEGQLYLVPSFLGDKSIDAYVTLLGDKMASFKNSCYSLD